MLHLFKWVGIFQTFTGIQVLRSHTRIIIAHIGFGRSLSIFKFHGSMKSIAHESEEAAYDGNGQFKNFFMSALTILKPVYVTILIMNVLWIWNDFLFPMLGDGKGASVPTLSWVVHNFAGAIFVARDLMMTSILMVLISISVFFLGAQKHIITGFVEGSVQ